MSDPLLRAIPYPAAPKKKKPWGKWLLILIVLALVGFGVSRCVGKKEAVKKPAAQATRVEVITLARQPIADKLLITGSLAPRHELPISAELAGLRIATVHVEEGDSVKEGQSLATLDTALLRTEYAQREALVAQRVAEQREADAYYARLKPLAGSGAVSAQELESREVAALTAQANTKSARAQLLETQTKLQQARVLAPAAGVVGQRTAEVGQLTGANTTPLFKLVEKGQIELLAEVPESDLHKLSIDQKANVWVGADRATGAEGTIRIIRPLVDAQTRLGLIRVALPKNPAFRAGAFARAEVTVGEHEALVVPLSAITYDDGRPLLTVVEDGKKAVQRQIKIGARQNNVAEILEGAKEGDVVVHRAANFLRDGDEVTAVAAGELEKQPVADAAAANAGAK